MQQRQVLVATVLWALAGCASVNQPINQQGLQSLQPGKSTVDEAVAALGAPMGRVRAADGTSVLTWYHARATVKPASFVPVVGLLAGGSAGAAQMVTLRFDAAGKLLTIDQAETATDVKLGPAP